MKPKSAKAKGRKLQDQVKDDLVKHLKIKNPKEVRKAIMGERGPDVVYRNFVAECTNTEYLRIWDKLAQLDHHIENFDAPNPLGVLVFKKNKSEVYATVKWKTFLHMIKTIKELLEERKERDEEQEVEDDLEDLLVLHPHGGSC